MAEAARAFWLASRQRENALRRAVKNAGFDFDEAARALREACRDDVSQLREAFEPAVLRSAFTRIEVRRRDRSERQDFLAVTTNTLPPPPPTAEVSLQAHIPSRDETPGKLESEQELETGRPTSRHLQQQQNGSAPPPPPPPPTSEVSALMPAEPQPVASILSTEETDRDCEPEQEIESRAAPHLEQLQEQSFSEILEGQRAVELAAACRTELAMSRVCSALGGSSSGCVPPMASTLLNSTDYSSAEQATSDRPQLPTEEDRLRDQLQSLRRRHDPDGEDSQGLDPLGDIVPPTSAPIYGSSSTSAPYQAASEATQWQDAPPQLELGMSMDELEDMLDELGLGDGDVPVTDPDVADVLQYLEAAAGASVRRAEARPGHEPVVRHVVPRHLPSTAEGESDTDELTEQSPASSLCSSSKASTLDGRAVHHVSAREHVPRPSTALRARMMLVSPAEVGSSSEDDDDDEEYWTGWRQEAKRQAPGVNRITPSSEGEPQEVQRRVTAVIPPAASHSNGSLEQVQHSDTSSVPFDGVREAALETTTSHQQVATSATSLEGAGMGDSRPFMVRSSGAQGRPAIACQAEERAGTQSLAAPASIPPICSLEGGNGEAKALAPAQGRVAVLADGDLRVRQIENSLASGGAGAVYSRDISFGSPLRTLGMDLYKLLMGGSGGVHEGSLQQSFCVLAFCEEFVSRENRDALLAFFLAAGLPKAPFYLKGLAYTVGLQPLDELSLLPLAPGAPAASKIFLMAVRRPTEMISCTSAAATEVQAWMDTTLLSDLGCSGPGSDASVSSVVSIVKQALHSGAASEGYAEPLQLLLRTPSFHAHEHQPLQSHEQAFGQAILPSVLSRCGEAKVETVPCILLPHIWNQREAMLAVLGAVHAAGLYLSGLRLIYMTRSEIEACPCAIPKHTAVEGELRVLALAIRGPQARMRWARELGPDDPALAKLTDPNSLRALWGVDREDCVALTHSMNPERSARDLAFWFGGRFSTPSLQSPCAGLVHQPHAQVAVAAFPPALPSSAVGRILSSFADFCLEIVGLRLLQWSLDSSTLLSELADDKFCNWLQQQDTYEESSGDRGMGRCLTIVARGEDAQHCVKQICCAYDGAWAVESPERALSLGISLCSARGGPHAGQFPAGRIPADLAFAIIPRFAEGHAACAQTVEALLAAGSVTRESCCHLCERRLELRAVKILPRLSPGDISDLKLSVHIPAADAERNRLLRSAEEHGAMVLVVVGEGVRGALLSVLSGLSSPRLPHGALVAVQQAAVRLVEHHFSASELQRDLSGGCPALIQSLPSPFLKGEEQLTVALVTCAGLKHRKVAAKILRRLEREELDLVGLSFASLDGATILDIASLLRLTHKMAQVSLGSGPICVLVLRGSSAVYKMAVASAAGMGVLAAKQFHPKSISAVFGEDASGDPAVLTAWKHAQVAPLLKALLPGAASLLSPPKAVGVFDSSLAVQPRALRNAPVDGSSSIGLRRFSLDEITALVVPLSSHAHEAFSALCAAAHALAEEELSLVGARLLNLSESQAKEFASLTRQRITPGACLVLAIEGHNAIRSVEALARSGGAVAASPLTEYRRGGLGGRCLESSSSTALMKSLASSSAAEASDQLSFFFDSGEMLGSCHRVESVTQNS
jgi:nucleoside diphosphate kinase